MADPKLHPLLYVEYLDHASASGWRDYDEVDTDPLSLVAVGWLLKETKDRLILAATHDIRTGNLEYPIRTTLRAYIEKPLITRRIKLKCPSLSPKRTKS